MADIPLSSPDITEAEIELVSQVLRTRYLSLGPMLERFEEEVAEYLGVRYAIGVSSGTAGLHICVRAANLGEGDEVITTSFSFVASSNCILFERARPIFVDIEPDTLNLDVEQVEAAITPRTRAILPVHAFGQPCPMDRLMQIAERHGLLVIEDACEALGAEYRGGKAGTFGDAGVFAFYPNKQMTTGEGGVIVTDREDWAQLARSLRNQGRGEDNAWLEHVRLGYNYRLDELSCALGVAQLGRIEELLVKRERVAQMYNQRLQKVEGVEIPRISPATTRMSWFLYVVRLSPELDRDQVMKALAAKGIPTRPYFKPIHLQPFYREEFGYEEGHLPITESVSQRTLALPFFGNLAEEEVGYICASLEEAVNQQRTNL